jgi:hypothetical protein
MLSCLLVVEANEGNSICKRIANTDYLHMPGQEQSHGIVHIIEQP